MVRIRLSGAARGWQMCFAPSSEGGGQAWLRQWQSLVPRPPQIRTASTLDPGRQANISPTPIHVYQHAMLPVACLNSTFFSHPRQRAGRYVSPAAGRAIHI